MSKFTARDVEVLSKLSAALQVINHDVTEVNKILMKIKAQVEPCPDGHTLIRMVQNDGKFYQIGDIGSVPTNALEDYEANFRGCYVDFNNQGNSYVHGDGRWFVRRGDFEILQPEAKSPKRLPLVGDKILVTDDVLPYFSKGDIALVIEVSEEQHHVTANFKDLGNPKVYLGGYWCVHFDNLEVIPHVDGDSK